MIFTKRLREGVRSGRITCSVRIWQRPHVTVGNRYRMDVFHAERHTDSSNFHVETTIECFVIP